MSERPSVIFASLLAAATVLGGLLVGGLAMLGGNGADSLASAIAGALTACIFSLVELRHVPIASLAAVVLAALSVVAFARTFRAYLSQRRILGSLPLEPLLDRHVLAMAGAAGTDVYLTPASRPTAFCFGLIRPRVVVTSGLLARLNSYEQAAVICHEAHHARAREPLRCLLARLAASTFFWLPLLADLLDRYLLVKEVAADRLAASRTGRRALAGALHEVAVTPTPAGAVGLAECAAARIDRLFDSQSSLPPLWRRSRLALTVLVAMLLAALAAVPGRVDLSGAEGFESMLLGGTPHGYAGACVGFLFNGLFFLAIAVAARQVLARRGPGAQ